MKTFAVDPRCVPLPPMPTPTASAHHSGVTLTPCVSMPRMIGIMAAVNGMLSIAAEKIASEMTRTAEENQALRIAAENAALKSENELLRKSATVNAGTPSKKSGDETKEADLPEQFEMYRGGDAARL